MSTHTTGSRSGSSAAALVRQGDALRKSGDFLRAEEVYRKAVLLDPRCADAWAELGCLIVDSRRFSESAACFRQLLGPRDEAGTDHSPQTAVQLLAEVVSRRPGWARGQFSLGCAYEHLGDNQRARGHLGNAMRLDPSRQDAVEALYARMYYLEKKWMDGVAASDRALKANPDCFLAHVIRSKCCAELVDMRGAVSSMRQAVEIAPYREGHSGLLFEMNYLPETTPETLYVGRKLT